MSDAIIKAMGTPEREREIQRLSTLYHSLDRAAGETFHPEIREHLLKAREHVTAATMLLATEAFADSV